MITAAPRTRPVRVVIIDDTFDLRELLRLALTRGGLEVVGEAGDGLAGIECVRLERPDVVLLDLSMPVMDGLEALPAIRRLIPEGKIVVLSGFGATQMSEKAMTIGADGYLQKGMALKKIIEYVKDLVEPAPAPALSVVPDPDPAASPEAQPGLAPEASLREALALAPYGVLEVVDEPLFRLVHANPTAQRLLDNRARFGVPLGSFAPELAALVGYHRLDGESSFEVVIGETRMRASLRRTQGSLLVYVDSSSEDIDTLRRAIASTAQEIRGPVAVLGGVAESITQSITQSNPHGGAEMPAAQRQRLMASVSRQARILDTLTADLLTDAEIQRGDLHLDPRPVAPLAVIETVVAEHYLVGVAAQVEDERQVLVDPDRLEQMLSNLVGNALKHGRAPYVVRVEADPAHADRVRLLVVDSGDGVPEDFRPDLFGEFSRPAGSVTTGTGLGLYVVKCLAEAHGGTVDYSPGPTGGAVFALSLPAV